MSSHYHCHIDNSKRTLLVIIITIITMLLEITYGFLTNSIALLADGWHMATHTLALGITYATYLVIKHFQKKKQKQKFLYLSEKISSLGGYTSSLLLFITAIWIIFEAITRFFEPLKISFDEAIWVAIIGLFVNLISIFIMGFKNHTFTKDYNYKAAYLHILTDIMTSIFAIIALMGGKYLGWFILDPITGIIAGIVILKWSLSLTKHTMCLLLDLKSVQN